MVKKGLNQEKEHKILCLETSLIISKRECAQWKERAAQLEKENQALKEKLGTNSRHSSKPPSQDPFRRSRSSRPTGNQGVSLAILATSGHSIPRVRSLRT